MCTLAVSGLSLELVVWVLLLLSHLVELLVLHEGTEASSDDNSHEVSIEPWSDAVDGSSLDLLSKGELVREATSIHGDTSPESVATNEGSHDDEDMVVDDKGQDGSDGGAGEADAPEESWASNLVEGHLVNEDSNHETSPGSKEGSSQSLDLHHEVAGKETNEE